MEEKTVVAIKCLEFLIKSFPEDDEPHKVLRDSLVATKEHLTALLEVLHTEEAKAFADAKEKSIKMSEVTPEMCPQPVKAETYEVEMSLAKKQQLLKEAVLARQQLAEAVADLDAQLAVLKPAVEEEEKKVS
jgi:hypothetical protein